MSGRAWRNMRAESGPLMKYKRVTCLYLVALILLCPLSASADPFRFGWPVPVSAIVKAKMHKKGNESTAIYTVRMSQRNTEEITLEFRDFKFLTLNGQDASDPRIAAQLGPLASLTSTLPTMRLSNHGEYLGMIGLETMMHRLLTAMPEEMDEASRTGLLDYFQSPKVQALMQQKSGEMWNVWVGAWNGLELEPGQTLKGSVPVTVMNKELSQQILIEHLGAANSYPGCVRLRMTTVVEGPEVLQIVTGMLQDLAKNLADEGESFDPAQLVSARSMSVTEVITQTRSLIPHYASSDTEVLIRSVGKKTHTQSDKKIFWFDWASRK